MDSPRREALRDPLAATNPPPFPSVTRSGLLPRERSVEVPPTSIWPVEIHRARSKLAVENVIVLPSSPMPEFPSTELPVHLATVFVVPDPVMPPPLAMAVQAPPFSDF